MRSQRRRIARPALALELLPFELVFLSGTSVVDVVAALDAKAGEGESRGLDLLVDDVFDERHF